MSKKNGQRTYRLGFDLGGTKMMAVLFDAEFNVVARAKRKTKGHKGAEEGLRRIFKTIDETLNDADVKPNELLGVGMAAPAPLDLKTKTLENPTNIKWGNVPVGDALMERYGCAMTLANDVDAGTYGEYRFGAGQGGQRVLGVFPGTGIGGGYVYEGDILKADNHPCMEIGHVIVQPGGQSCGCGNRGCLETVASRLSISAQAAQAAFRGEAPNLYESAGTDIAKMGSRTLAKAIESGDAAIESIVRDAAGWLGIGIANAVNLLNPDVIVLGGGLVEAMPSIFVEEVKKSLTTNSFSSFKKSWKVNAATLGDDAAVMGAAAMLDTQAEEL